jgi:hypothetical protein
MKNHAMERTTETYVALTKWTSYTVLKAHPYPTSYDGILSNLNTNSSTPRTIATNGTEIRDQAAIQRYNPLILQDKYY